MEKIVDAIRKMTDLRPEIVCVFGSGWGVAADWIEDPVRIPYSSLPGMPTCTVAGHGGYFLLGTLFSRRVIAAVGRFHLYEGYRADEVVLPVRLGNALGAGILLATNAAGGIASDFCAGELMAIEDHINLTGANPLAGRAFSGFPDMTRAYDPAFVDAILRVGNEKGVAVRRGVYAQMLGPSYETPAEIRFLRTIGADAVGMSTAVETIAARGLGMRVAGISCITNLAAGLADSLDHGDVLAVARKREDAFRKVLSGLLPVLE